MDIAVIMPVYGQGPLLCEAINSVLEQRTRRDYKIILVDDSCPAKETVDTCKRYARMYPDKVFYWRSPENRGLAAMRNEGVKLALAMWPDLRAVLFFDGDDRLHPRMLERAADALDEAKNEKTPDGRRIGWIYEDPDHFGIDGISIRPHRFSTLFFMAGCANTSSSLIDADMFREGLRYREDMRSGGEDWQFWNKCIKHGFRGKYVPHIGFRYRLKSGSMSAGAAIVASRNRTNIRLSLPDVFHPQYFLNEEQNEAPRHLIISEGSIFFQTTGSERTMDMKSLVSALALYNKEPTSPIPQYIYFIAPETIESLKLNKTLDYVLWRLEMMAGKENLINARLLPSKEPETELEIAVDKAFSTESQWAEIICVSSKLLLDLMTNRINLDTLKTRKKIRQTNFWMQNTPKTLVTKDFSAILEQAKLLYNRYKMGYTRHKAALWKPFGVERYDMADHFFGSTPVLALPQAGDEVILIVRERDLEIPEIRTIVTSLADQLRERQCALLVLGKSIDRKLARHFSRLFLLKQNGPIIQAGNKAFLGLLSPFGTIISIACANIAGDLNQLRRFGRNILAVLPDRDTGATELHEDLVHCFKVFKGVYCTSETELSRAEALGVAPEQLVSSIRKFLELAAGSEPIPT